MTHTYKTRMNPRRAYFQRFMRRVMYARMNQDFEELQPLTTAQYRAMLDNVKIKE